MLLDDLLLSRIKLIGGGLNDITGTVVKLILPHGLLMILALEVIGCPQAIFASLLLGNSSIIDTQVPRLLI